MTPVSGKARQAVCNGCLRAIFGAAAVLAGLSACEAPPEPGYQAGPRAYVAFYLPANDPAYAELHLDVQIYRLDDGQRVFAGALQKWKNLRPERAGLTVPVAPGRHAFSVEMAGGAATVALDVRPNIYYPVRIGAANIVRGRLIGASDRIRFDIRVTPEQPVPPGSALPTQASRG